MIKAFTHATVKEELYMLPPPGFGQGSDVCKLNRTVEGTKQAAHEFMTLNVKTIEKEGFIRDLNDPNLFRREKDGILVLLGVYVDNLLLSSPRGNEAAKKQVNEFLGNYGKVIRLELRGQPKVFMGIEIIQEAEEGRLSLSQKNYITETFHKFCNASTKQFGTPVAPGQEVGFAQMKGAKVEIENDDGSFSINEAETEKRRAAMLGKPYKSLMGCLLWILMTRADVYYHTATLCQHMSDPCTDNWDAGIALLAYLYATRELGLIYTRIKGGETCTIDCYADSSFRHKGQPKPQAGFCIFVNKCLVSYSSRKLIITPQSSCEAEIAACCNGAKSTMFVRSVMQFLGLMVKMPMNVITDNDAAMHAIRNPGTTQRTRHFESWQMYCRELKLRLLIEIFWIPTADMIADIFTKCVDKTTFLRLRSKLVQPVHILPGNAH